MYKQKNDVNNIQPTNRAKFVLVPSKAKKSHYRFVLGWVGGKKKSPIGDCSTNIFYFFSFKLEDKS
ncbi:uncharacterized protein METZ01_LOCUS367760 [marine metagenome]|uniref:Uncharacterized protein n=1 Tax=marine metagenome TaxID=408172 RepID=A0A382SYE6_9ZZZZ